MSYTLSFGEYAGKTHEWLFFNAPWYAEYICDNDIDLQEDRMTEEEGEHFRELYRRASRLTFQCRDCQDRPVRRLGLTWQQNGNLGLIGFYCEECEYLGGSSTAYHPASFFVEAHTLSRVDQKRIVKEIHRIYFDGRTLTQKRMEEFFHNDANFSEATPGFFAASNTSSLA